MQERQKIWKYCSREQSMEFLLSLHLTGTEKRERALAQLYELSNHPERTGIREEPQDYLGKLMGKVQYILQIDPKNEEFTQYKKEIQKKITKKPES